MVDAVKLGIYFTYDFITMPILSTAFQLIDSEGLI